MKPTLYKPRWPGYKANPNCCNETVYDKWRIDVVGHQCSRKHTMMIDGVGLCKVHAKRYATPPYEEAGDE